MRIRRGSFLRIEIINRKKMKAIRLLIINFLCSVFCLTCGTPCKKELVIYQTPYFKKGQEFKLFIDDQVVVSKEFDEEFHSNDFTIIETYCYRNDSSIAKFTLDGKDTTFGISWKRTNRLLIGSDINGNFSVATDENKRAWIKM